MWLLIAVSCVFVLLWTASLYVAHRSTPQDLAKLHPVLIIAHPDDEVMFFLPLILALRPNLAVLCLSTGNYDGLGELRKAEFTAVMEALEISNYEISDSFPDGWQTWPAEAVGRRISAYLAEHSEVDSIVTFDVHGISGHPNHISINRSLNHLTKKRDLLVFELRTVGFLRKYLLPPLEALLSPDPGNFYVANFHDPLSVFRHMRLYKSQNVWFRKIYALLSRYAYLNSFHVRVI